MEEFTKNEVVPEIGYAEPETLYRALQPKYEKLATEVEYILQDALIEERVPIASVSKRVKSVASFANKLRRKTYKDPLSEVTDFAGVRIVSYFRGDLPRLERMIGRLFQVREKDDKLARLETDKFGYMAVQFIVCLKESFLGARYDDLKGLMCEIQTRAVLADAWAILNHHLVYKKEAALPQDSARKIHALAAIIENAESQFEDLREEIEEVYLSAKSSSGDGFLDQPINASTVAEFIEKLVPNIQVTDKEEEASLISSLIDRTRFRTLADIQDAVLRSREAVVALRKETAIFPGQELEYALAFVDTSMRSRYADWFEALFKKHRHLVEESKRTII